MPRSVRSFLALALLGVTSAYWVPAVTAAEESLFRVRIRTSDKVMMRELITSELDVTHAHPGEADVLVNQAELDDLRGRGYPVEVLREFAARPDLRGGTPEFLPEYFTFTEAEAKLAALAATYPSITSLSNIGSTHNGRTMWALKISDNPGVDENEPEVLIMGNHHAREAISIIIPFALADSLLMNYGTDAQYTEWVDEREIWIVPVVNPDGVTHCETTNYFWRKNRRANANGTFGVDPNRNYNYQWAHDNVGSSGTQGSDIYRGPSAASEPEIQAIQNLVDSREFVASLSFHSFGNWLLWGTGYKPSHTPDQDIYEGFGAIVSAENGYEPGNPASSTIYVTNGDADDWLYSAPTHGPILAMTPEVGNDDDYFNPPAARIPTLIVEGLECVWPVLEHADRPGRLAPPGPSAVDPLAVDGDGNYNVTWSPPVLADTEPVLFELVEKTGLATSTDGLEAGTGNFSLDGFATSGVRKFAGSFSLYSGSGDRLDRICYLGEPRFVQAGDSFTFRAWWSIENGWDYAYAILSTDGGRSFVPLQGTTHTTMTDPNGRNADHGITGTSGGVFVPLSFSLAAWEGQTVWLGVRYNTDEGVANEGIYVDDVHPVQTFATETTLSSAIPSPTFPVVGRANGTYYYQVRGRDAEFVWGYPSANVPVVVALATDVAVVPAASRISLSGGAPNPFDRQTEIEFQLPALGSHSLIVYDVAGRHVRTLSQGVLTPGTHKAIWNGRDDRGRDVPAGVYFYMLRAAQGELRRRVVMVR